MGITLPKDVQFIIERIEAAGKEAFAVGGCIRDSIIGKRPSDWDITTSAKPAEIKRIFLKTVDTGIKHGTVTVILGKKPYEVTTYRVDGAYSDGRHPDEVRFTSSLKEDLSRRDFTINAMAYNEKKGLVDAFGGLYDLKNRVIRAVGSPDRRFKEDALRMMRAVRFSAQLGFNIDMDTYMAIADMSYLIGNVSMERVRVELEKTLMSSNPDYIIEYSRTGLFNDILPLMNGVLADRLSGKLLHLLREMPDDRYLRYTAIYKDKNPADVKRELKKLKLDNDTIDTVTKLISYLGLNIAENATAVREAIYKYGRKYLELIFAFREAEIRHKEEVTGLSVRRGRLHLRAIVGIYSEIIKRGDCTSLSDLAVTGEDIKKLGYSGREIGEKLEWLLHIVLENPELNNKTTLLSLVENE